MTAPGRGRAELKRAILARITDYREIYKDLKGQRDISNDWVSARCPFHDDREPSFSFHRTTGAWTCHAGCGKGDVFSYLMKKTGQSFPEVLEALGQQFGVARPERDADPKPTIGEHLVQVWTDDLWAHDALRARLQELRGLSAETLRRFQIGWDSKTRRYTIPIRDEDGQLANIRLYDPSRKPKMKNYVAGRYRYGSPPRLFGADDLKRREGAQVILAEGEWDRILSEQEGFLAVTGTHGAGTFLPSWAPYFQGRHVVVAYDCDAEGKAAVEQGVLPVLRNASAASVKVVPLPLSGSKEDKDVSDYFLRHGGSAEALRQLIDQTPEYAFDERSGGGEEAVVELASFTEIEKAALAGRRVRCEVTISGETSESFHAVESFRIGHCSGREEGLCHDCRGYPEAAQLPRGAQEYIGSCMSTNCQVVGMLRTFACRHRKNPTIEIASQTTIKELFCHQRVRRIIDSQDAEGQAVQLLDGKRQELLEKRVYLLSSDHPKPGDYVATGWVRSHPKTQQITFLIEALEALEKDFEAFSVEANLALLHGLRAFPYEALLDDLTRGVTRIYDRRDILEAVLLTFASPLWIPFNRELIRGWIISVIIGDSGAGKTQTAQRFAEHVGLGDIFSGLTGSRTGLTYALVEDRNRGWQVRIGRYPANSRRLLIVDEAQFLPSHDIRTLAKAMDEGFLQIDRVQSRGYESQTRLILLANPKRDATMDTFAFGCQALASVFPPTIIRRIDIAVFANAGDLTDLSIINRAQPVEHAQVGADLLRALIFWAWNLKPEQIVFTSEGEGDCLRAAPEMAEIFGYAVDVPLVCMADVRKKLARVAVAFAVLHLSTDENFTRLVVEPKHVALAMTYLYRLYAQDNCALNDYSEIERLGSQLGDYDEIARAFQRKAENERKFGHDDERRGFARMVQLLRTNDAIRREDLAEQAGCSVETVKRAIQLLRRHNLIDSTKDGYVKKPKFNKFLRRYLREHRDFFVGQNSGSTSNPMEDQEFSGF